VVALHAGGLSGLLVLIWGGDFGGRSGLWTWSARVAVVLLAGITAWLVCTGQIQVRFTCLMCCYPMGLGFALRSYPVRHVL
jgi:hypothetical protein